jgi:hypothetical protein
MKIVTKSRTTCPVPILVLFDNVLWPLGLWRSRNTQQELKSSLSSSRTVM